MTAIRIVIARIRALFRRDATLDEIHDETQFHLQMRDRRVRTARADPQRRARRRCGGSAIPR